MPPQGSDAETSSVVELAAASTSVLPLPPGSLVRSNEAFPGLLPFTMTLHLGLLFLGHWPTCLLLEQSCVGDLRELSLNAANYVAGSRRVLHLLGSLSVRYFKAVLSRP